MSANIAKNSEFLLRIASHKAKSSKSLLSDLTNTGFQKALDSAQEARFQKALDSAQEARFQKALDSAQEARFQKALDSAQEARFQKALDSAQEARFQKALDSAQEAHFAEKAETSKGFLGDATKNLTTKLTTTLNGAAKNAKKFLPPGVTDILTKQILPAAEAFLPSELVGVANGIFKAPDETTMARPVTSTNAMAAVHSGNYMAHNAALNANEKANSLAIADHSALCLDMAHNIKNLNEFQRTSQMVHPHASAARSPTIQQHYAHSALQKMVDRSMLHMQ